MAAPCVYASVSCNPSPHCLDWNENNIICFGACHSVVIYDPKFIDNAGVVLHTLVSHKGSVNSVKWIPSKTGYEIVSGSVDKTIVVWQEDRNTNGYLVKEVLQGHEGAVRVVRPFSSSETEETWLASASSDSSLRIWRRNSTITNFCCIQTISFGNGFALDAAWAVLPESTSLLLVVAIDDSKIHLYCQDEESQFQKKLTLSGHEDWVSGLDVTTDECGDLLLSSCSQDTFVRLWKLSEVKRSLVEFAENKIKLRDNRFTVGSENEKEYSVTLESVLSGHENWVTNVHWSKKRNKGSLPELLSSSTDKSLIVWKNDVDSGLWLEKVRVGEVGGNTVGFFDAVFSPDGLTILATGHQGAFHMWTYKKEKDVWEASVVVHGHSQEVADICWDPQGSFLLSCSLDQTTRLHAPWCQGKESLAIKNKSKVTWHEVARPQIHGYDLWSVATLGSGFFASAGEEKVIRVFACTKNFCDNFNSITHIDYSKLIERSQPELPEGASVPSLGLSNKAVFTSDLNSSNQESEAEIHPKDQYPEHYFKPVLLSGPPPEDLLLQNTLWPEIQKLYGHGYEVFALAANHSGTLLASTCKASKPEYACIILWETSGWQQVGQLPHHSLTVTQMAFSPNDLFLLSVSRDRTWALFQKQTDGLMYQRVACTDKSTSLHSRIIWACAWSHDSKFFATSSRDKKVVIWSVSPEGKVSPASTILDTTDSATALDFLPLCTSEGRYLLGIGQENGNIFLYTWLPKEGEQSADWKLFCHLNETHAHHLCVKRLRFSPTPVMNGRQFALASCSTDHFVKIFIFDIFKE